MSYPSYLSPWYFRADKPGLSFAGRALRWDFLEKIDGKYSGVYRLMDSDTCLGVVAIYTYIQPILNGTHFIAWKRGANRLELFETASLSPVSDIAAEMEKMKSQNISYVFYGKKEVLDFKIIPDQEKNRVSFPQSFKKIDEILIVTELDKMDDPSERLWQNTALLVAKPKEDMIYVYPQDWFNQDAKMDFGYQWITRAKRHWLTRLIHVEGIRLGTRILGKSNRR